MSCHYCTVTVRNLFCPYHGDGATTDQLRDAARNLLREWDEEKHLSFFWLEMLRIALE